MDKVVYFASYEGDLGEAEAMFDSDGSLLGLWACNDGNWRGEYFDSFLRGIGVTIDYSGVCDDKMEEIIKEAWGG